MTDAGLDRHIRRYQGVVGCKVQCQMELCFTCRSQPKTRSRDVRFVHVQLNARVRLLLQLSDVLEEALLEQMIREKVTAECHGDRRLV